MIKDRFEYTPFEIIIPLIMIGVGVVYFGISTYVAIQQVPWNKIPDTYESVVIWNIPFRQLFKTLPVVLCALWILWGWVNMTRIWDNQKHRLPTWFALQSIVYAGMSYGFGRIYFILSHTEWKLFLEWVRAYVWHSLNSSGEIIILVNNLHTHRLVANIRYNPKLLDLKSQVWGAVQHHFLTTMYIIGGIIIVRWLLPYVVGIVKAKVKSIHATIRKRRVDKEQRLEQQAKKRAGQQLKIISTRPHPTIQGKTQTLMHRHPKPTQRQLDTPLANYPHHHRQNRDLHRTKKHKPKNPFKPC